MSEGPIVFIVNPRSANGATLRKFDRARARFAAELGGIEVRLTERPRHATDLAREAVKAGARAVIAVGGDGTNNEVINGFFDASGEPLPGGCAFGVVTSGTGGDFRRTFGWSTDLEEALSRLKRMQTRRIDLGRMRFTTDEGDKTWYYVNSSSFGLVGVVVDIANHSSKALGPQVAFVTAALKALAAYKSPDVRVVVDDQPPRQGPFLLGSVANGKYFGGGMKIAPDAEPDDGKLDCVLVEGRGALLARHIPKLYLGTHPKMPIVSVQRCARVTAEPVDPTERLLVELDGEQPGRLPATWDVVPQALPLLV